MPTSPAERIAELRDVLDRANRAYYIDAAPLMSDSEFDMRMAELIRLELAHPEFHDPNSPSAHVGAEAIDRIESRPHSLPMLSIDNTYSEQDVRDWYGRVCVTLVSESVFVPSLFARHDGGKPQIVCEPKIDGVAISLRYESGYLKQALTRGDGVKGDDVVHNARVINSIPKRLRSASTSASKLPAVLEVRGEVFLSFANFEKANLTRDQEGEEPFMNPRNTAAGTLKQLDPSEVRSRGLEFFAHGIGQVSDADFADTHWRFREKVHDLGIPVGPHASLCRTIDEALEVIDRFAAIRGSLPFATDGMVVRVDDFSLQQALGSTSKSPRWIIAYKYPAEQKPTKLLHVSHQVGKTGKITPRATMEPVLLAGTTVRNATLHNYGRIRDAATEDPSIRTDIRIGDTVLVEKAGEIIPYVSAVVLAKRPGNAQPIVPPAHCPVCSGPVEVEPPEAVTNDSLETQRRCINPQCPAQVREKLIWFAGRKQMDIDGLGEKTIDLIRATSATATDDPPGLAASPIPLNTFADIFRLHRYRDRLVTLDRMGEKKVDNLLAGIDAAKSRGMAKVLAGMGIRYVGDSTAKLLAKQFDSIDALLAADEPMLRPKAMTKDEAARNGLPADPKDRPSTELGLTTAPVVHAFLHSPAATAIFRELRELGVDLSSKEYKKPGGAGVAGHAATDSTPSIFGGTTVVITGTLEHYEREALKELLESLGAKVSGSVSSKTSFLIVGADAGSKLDKARDLGVPIMDEPQLLRELAAAGKR